MLREGVVPLNVARLVRTPKAPQKLPEVMTAEQANALLDGVAARQARAPFPARDRAIFELLYGCGIRVSELAGLNLEDIDRSDGWLRVRGKGKKERQVPLPGKAAEALERYLGERPVVRDERAVFLNHRNARLTTRGISGIVKLYSTYLAGDPSRAPAQLPPRLRHAPARRRRRPARHPGTARPRPPLHHTEVHAGFAHRPDGGLRQGAPQSMIAGFRKEIRPMLRLAAPLAMAELGWMAMGFVDTRDGRPPRRRRDRRRQPRRHALLPDRRSAAPACWPAWIRWSRRLSAQGTMTTLPPHSGQRLWIALGDCARSRAVAALTIPLLRAIGTNPRVMELLGPFVHALLWGVPPLLFYTAFRRYLQARNIVRPITFAVVSANLLNFARQLAADVRQLGRAAARVWKARASPRRSPASTSRWCC